MYLEVLSACNSEPSQNGGDCVRDSGKYNYVCKHGDFDINCGKNSVSTEVLSVCNSGP